MDKVYKEDIVIFNDKDSRWTGPGTVMGTDSNTVFVNYN